MITKKLTQVINILAGSQLEIALVTTNLNSEQCRLSLQKIESFMVSGQLLDSSLSTWRGKEDLSNKQKTIFLLVGSKPQPMTIPQLALIWTFSSLQSTSLVSPLGPKGTTKTKENSKTKNSSLEAPSLKCFNLNSWVWARSLTNFIVLPQAIYYPPQTKRYKKTWANLRPKYSAWRI